jgi:hypothetical protein
MKHRKQRIFQMVALFVLAALMFLASGLHGSYFCVAPWTGGDPLPESHNNANP